MYINLHNKYVNGYFNMLFYKMVCRFDVLFAPWQKDPENLLSHDCVGLKEERKLSCHPDAHRNDEENMVKPVEVKVNKLNFLTEIVFVFFIKY